MVCISNIVYRDFRALSSRTAKALSLSQRYQVPGLSALAHDLHVDSLQQSAQGESHLTPLICRGHALKSH
jgi:hypothetical protein